MALLVEELFSPFIPRPVTDVIEVAEALIACCAGLLGWDFARREGMDCWLMDTGPTGRPGIYGGPIRRPVAGPAEGQAVLRGRRLSALAVVRRLHTACGLTPIVAAALAAFGASRLSRVPWCSEVRHG